MAANPSKGNAAYASLPQRSSIRLGLMDPASPESQQASPFGLATLKKAVNVIAHYVDFSDNSSSWTGSDKDGAETPHNNEDLQTPLLQSESAQAHKAEVGLDNAINPAEVAVSGPAATLDKTSLVSAAEVNIPLDPEVQSPHRDADRASSSNDGAQTPTRHDLRTPVLQSQPMDQGTVSPAQSDSPKVAPSGGLELLGSGLLDPSLLEQLLDEHAPPPDMPYAPIRHVEPVLAAEHPDVESAGHPALKSHGSGWILTTFIMVAEMFGLGILTLPADFARLGWAVGLGLVLLFCLGMMYSGLLFSQLGAKVPTARVYEDFAAASLGKHGRWLVYSTVYLVIFLDPIIFHLTATQSLQQIFYQKSVPLWVAGVVVSVIMLPLSQLQDIGEVAVISIIGTVGMMTAVVIATLKLLMMDVEGAHHEAVHNDGFNVAIVALMDIVFTFGGQQNWMRYIGGMRRKSDFRYSATVGSIFMTTFYLILGGVGYWKMGLDFDHSKPITSVLPEDIWTSVMNIGLFAHCIIAYQIDLNVWTDLILDFTARRSPTVNKSPRRQRMLWLITSVIGIAFAASMAYLLPFFSTIMGLIAAIGDLSAAYALPALFSLCLMRREMPVWEQALCFLLIPVSVLLSAFGIYSSVYQLILQFTGRV
ncbi:hypothetical protein WJX77_006953 [Trebouxia sp. C0004]